MTRTELLASLAAGHEDINGVMFDDDERYMDWSTKLSDDAGRIFEAGDDAGNVASVGLIWPEIERLHRALTLLLLERDETTEA